MRRSANVLKGDVAERYAIEGEIGRGGTAIVYRARDRQRGIDVAIKLMRDDAMGSLSIDRFLLEIRQTARLPHPHIVPVLDSGEHEGRPFFVLPFMDGGTLRERLVRSKQLQFDEVITLGVTIARALDFAHSHGVIHRDVKPENILYNNGQACLADFGTARALERAANDPTTSTGVVRGTAAYMSPEQASGEREYDGRTDIYSLACVLYEAIAGIQPFVGPTMQAVIAQRLSHAPRPVSVYRPTVPLELEQVLERAVALSPADRYQTAGALASALEGAIPSLGRPRQTPPAIRGGISRARRGLVFGMVALTVAIALWLARQSGVRLPFVSGPLTGDTTLVAIMPVEVTDPTGRVAGQELFGEGLRYWTGVSAIETFATNDAIKRRGRGELSNAIVASLSIAEIAELASGLGAGRFIKSRVTNTSGLNTVYASLFDVASKKDLYHASIPLPSDTATWPGAYADLTDSLMLRGARDIRPPSSRRASQSLPGYQTFLRGRVALSEWDLEAADSLFRSAISFDTTMTRAHLWIAQVRNWKGQLAATWSREASRAIDDSNRLTPAEKRQAVALHALGSGDFQRACAEYAHITELAPSDFTGWYGLGDCHRLDRLVVPDRTSPSQWRYRSSYQQAIVAYQRAFQLLPSSYQGVQLRAFEPLRQFLYTGSRLRRGHGQDGPSGGFLSRPALYGDTILFVPYPDALVREGFQLNDPIAEERAWQRSRAIFRKIVDSWSVAFPQSAVVKEGVAISLEILGDPAAADSFRAARSLTSDPRLRLRLAVEEAIVRIKFAVYENPDRLAATAAFADSIIRNSTVRTSEDAELVGRLATLTGRCDDASRFARLAGNEFPGVLELTPSVAADTRAFIARYAAGCRETAVAPRIFESLRRAGLPEPQAIRQERDMIAAIVAMSFPRDSGLVRRLADSSGDYVLAAELLLMGGDTAGAKKKVASVTMPRLNRSTGDVSLDGALTDARLWLMLGDTALAVRLLDKALLDLRYAQPLAGNQFTLNQMRIGAIGAVMELRGDLATRNPAVRSRWWKASADLWSFSDPEVRQRVASKRATSNRK